VQHHKLNAEGGGRKTGYHELEMDIVEGESYLVEEQSRDFSYGIFASMVEDNYKGIGITRINPRLLRSKINGAKPRMLWLTDHESTQEETISPSLEKIMVILEEFILKNELSVVLVDDLQYLISCNTFEGAVRFIRNLVDKVSERSAVFLLSVDPNSLNPQERSVLERELRVVRDR
jgi:archaellum biogenesis ATPase FlaH